MQIALLDQIWIKYGYDELSNYFRMIAEKNVDDALRLINDANLMFPALFILHTQIDWLSITDFLHERNRIAIKIINDLKQKETLTTEEFLPEIREQYYPVLRWILKTGYREDGCINDQYDEILDTAAILLALVYGERSCLPLMEQLIFQRNRRKAFNYDLIWALFEVSDLMTLEMITNRLKSENKSDIRLARKFLNFIPCISQNSEKDPVKQYYECRKWLNQNQKQLFYTGETNLQTGNPSRYALYGEVR